MRTRSHEHTVFHLLPSQCVHGYNRPPYMSYLLGSLIAPASRLAQPNWEGLSDMHRSDSSIELGNKLQGGLLLLRSCYII